MHTRARWIVVLLCLVIVALAYYFFVRSLTPPVQEQRTELPVQIIAPEIASLEEAAQYIGDKPLPEPVPADRVPPFEADEHVWGDPSTPVALVLYANLSSSYSHMMIDALQSYVGAHERDVHMVLRNFPLTADPLDYTFAETAECLYVQQEDPGYWRFLETAYAQPTLSETSLQTAARTLRANMTTLQTCLDEEHTWDYIVAQKQDAQVQAGITVAPSLIVLNRTSGDVRIAEGLNPVSYIERIVADVR